MLTNAWTAEHGQALCSPENPYRLATDTLASPSLSLSQIVDEESAEKKSLGMSGSCEVLIVPPQHPVTRVSICLQTHILTRVEQHHKHTHTHIHTRNATQAAQAGSLAMPKSTETCSAEEPMANTNFADSIIHKAELAYKERREDEQKRWVTPLKPPSAPPSTPCATAHQSMPSPSVKNERTAFTPKSQAQQGLTFNFIRHYI